MILVDRQIRIAQATTIKSNTIPANDSSEKHARFKKENSDKSTSYFFHLGAVEGAFGEISKILGESVKIWTIA